MPAATAAAAPSPPSSRKRSRSPHSDDDGGDAPLPPPRARGPAAASQPALPWMRVPLPVAGGAGVPLARVTGLDGRVVAWLQQSGCPTLFPVQAAVWAAAAGGRGGAHDLAIASPTGSGKTLAYGLPALHALLDRGGDGAAAGRPPPRRCPRTLGALVVVPTRDLAAQVGAVLGPLFGCAGLTVAVAAGGRDPAAEAAALAGGAALAPDTACGDYGLSAPPLPPADCVVTTPGRLAAHLARLGPAGARHALGGLRMIIVDEADRLLRQHYGGWLDALNDAAPPAGGGVPRCVRVAASATLTRDPAKLGRLRLWRPRCVAAATHGRGGGGGSGAAPTDAAPPAPPKYALPAGLRLARLDVRRGGPDKPAALLACLRQLAAASTPALVFCGSIATAASVAAFLRAVRPPFGDGGAAGDGGVALLTSAVPGPARAAALASLAAGALPVAVASDGATRGIDAPGVGAVISYDPPTHAKALVHRAGRTARAGREGTAIALIRPVDGRHYAGLLERVGGGGGGTGGGGTVWRVPRALRAAARADAAAALAAAGEEGRGAAAD